MQNSIYSHTFEECPQGCVNSSSRPQARNLVMPFLVLTQLLENMTEVVRKGIQEAQVQLQRANEERLMEEVRLQTASSLGQAGSWIQHDGPEECYIL